VASWFFSSISSHHVSKSFQTSRNTPNCEFAKHIIAKVCGLNMIERQFWIFWVCSNWMQLEFHWRNIWLPWKGHYCKVIETSHLYSCKVMPPSSLLVYKPI
jgi:hypothetical protein